MDPLTAAFVDYMQGTVLPDLTIWLVGLLPAFMGLAILVDFMSTAARKTPG